LVLKDLKENNALGRLSNASHVSAMMRDQSVNQADLTSKIAHDFTSLGLQKSLQLRENSRLFCSE
jgi:hypothetical protein